MPLKIRKIRERGVEAIQGELYRLIEDAEEIVKTSKILLDMYTKEEQYFKANEMKAAISIHKQFIYRLERIRAGLTAFDEDDIMVYDLQENKEGIT